MICAGPMTGWRASARTDHTHRHIELYLEHTAHCPFRAREPAVGKHKITHVSYTSCMRVYRTRIQFIKPVSRKTLFASAIFITCCCLLQICKSYRIRNFLQISLSISVHCSSGGCTRFRLQRLDYVPIKPKHKMYFFHFEENVSYGFC